ncbi:hypothetical protein GCM10017688_32740 [Streptomyces ramulosus]
MMRSPGRAASGARRAWDGRGAADGRMGWFSSLVVRGALPGLVESGGQKRGAAGWAGNP